MRVWEHSVDANHGGITVATALAIREGSCLQARDLCGRGKPCHALGRTAVGWLWHRKVGNRAQAVTTGAKRGGSPYPRKAFVLTAAGATFPSLRDRPDRACSACQCPEPSSRGTAQPLDPGAAPLTCKPRVMGRQMAGGQAEVSRDPSPTPQDMLLRLRESFLGVRRKPRRLPTAWRLPAGERALWPSWALALGNWLARVSWGPRLRHGRSSAGTPRSSVSCKREWRLPGARSARALAGNVDARVPGSGGGVDLPLTVSLGSFPSQPCPGFREDPFQPLPAGRLEAISCSSSQTGLKV